MLILGGQLTLNLGSHFATLLGLPLTMLILEGVPIDTQLGKSLCNFAGITSDNVDPGGGGGGQSTLNLGSHFATLLGLPLTMLILGVGGGSIDTQLGKSLCNFAGITSDNVDPGGSIYTQLGKSLCNFAGITSDNVDPGGSIDTQIGKSLCNFAGITSDNVDPGGSINTQLGKSLCNFAGITSDNVDPGGVNHHSTWKVTLQFCWDYL